jgi:diacylglycerol kinase family enzyme
LSVEAAPPSRWPAPSAGGRPGAGLAVLVNSNAKRGGRRVAVQIARALPGASVRLTKSAGEIDAWLPTLSGVRAVLAAGGDGTAVALVNALARVTAGGAGGQGEIEPVVGVLPLGTGNGWAHSLGAPKLHQCLDLLAAWPGALPTRRYGLFDVEGTLAHFAGSGWDAMILDDYKQQLESSRGPGRHFSKSVYGYLSATLLRTVPRVAIHGNPRVLIENLGDEVLTVDAHGTPRRMDGVTRGAVLYDGPFGTASVGTCPEFGYRFRAFPFAERLPGMFNARVYQRSAAGAVANIPRLWRGQHPLPGMFDWFSTHVRMTFSREMPVQIGGDAGGLRRTVEYRMSPRALPMVDWRRMVALKA